LAANKRKILEAARKHAQKGAKDKALSEFGKLLRLDPRDSKVRLEMGDTYRRWGQVAEAIEAYRVVADQFMHEGFDARAVAVFKQIQNLQPDTFSYHEPLAELYQRMGLTAEAIGSLESAAESYRKAGQKQEALGLLRKMAAIDPSNTTSRIKVADLLQQEGMKEDAISEYDAVVAELEMQGDTETAAKLFERILEIQPERVETLVLYTRNLIGSGSAQRAESLAKRALDINRIPEHFELLADVYRMNHRDEELVALYRELAELYRERGDEERTREILQRYVPLEEIGSAETPNGYINEDEHLDEEEYLDELSVGDETTLLDGDLLADSSLLVSDDDSGFGILSDDGGLDDLGSDGLDLISDSNEMTSLLPDKPSRRASSRGSDDAEAAIDVSQLLAEASVYLRYGKRSQAIANLESILVRDSNHRLALEKLGEALAEGDDSAKAVETWSRAAKLAAESGEADAAEVLRSRIAALDPGAAEALDLAVRPEPETGSSERPIPSDLIDDEIDDLSLTEDLAAESPDGDSASLGDEDLPELDLAEVSVRGMDIEIDIDDASFAREPSDEHESTEREAAATENDDASLADDDMDEISIDDLLSANGAAESDGAEVEDEAFDSDATGSGDVEADDFDSDATGSGEIELDDFDRGASESGETEVDDDDVSSEALTVDGAGTGEVSPEKIAEELEEADFYLEQGLFDEAEAVYSRILSIAPNHPHAMVRLGELAAQRGEASGSVVPTSDPASAGAGLAEGISEESVGSDIGADLADWQEKLPALEEREASEQPGAFEADALTLEDSSESAAADVVAEAESNAVADAPDERENLAGEDLVASESDLAADLGLDDPSDIGLEPEDDDGDSSGAEERDETGELPNRSSKFDAAEEPDKLTEPGSVEVAESSVGVSSEAPDGVDESAEDGDNFGFDLAAELSQSFDRDPGASGSGATGRGDTSEDGFASVFAEFKKGVSETLNEGDHQAHYDLGIAYREMGLLNDAITELRLAMRDPERRVGCLHLMGICAHEMGEPEQAIGHFTEALASDGVSGETVLALKLDLGASHQATGDVASARSAYEEIQAIDPNFSDVASRLDELGKPEDDEPEEDESQETEEYESFAEFLGDLDAPAAAEAEAAQESSGEAEAAPTWESFDDVVAEVDAEDRADSALREAEAAASADSAADADDSAPAESAEETERTPKRRKKKISFV